MKKMSPQSQLFLIFSLLLSAIATASAAADETQLIEKTCTETLERNECSQCILSDHSRKTNSTEELIHSLLFCMYSEATHAHVNADLLSQNATRPALKSTLSQCSSSLFEAANRATDAMMSIEGKAYQKAWDDSKDAKQMLFKCVAFFRGNADLNIPSSVLEHIIPAKHLFDAADSLFPLIVQ